MSTTTTEQKTIIKPGEILAETDKDYIGCSVMISYSRKGKNEQIFNSNINVAYETNKLELYIRIYSNHQYHLFQVIFKFHLFFSIFVFLFNIR
jgi:hypothetical protein